MYHCDSIGTDITVVCISTLALLRRDNPGFTGVYVLLTNIEGKDVGLVDACERTVAVGKSNIKNESGDCDLIQVVERAVGRLIGVDRAFLFLQLIDTVRGVGTKSIAVAVLK